MKLERIQTSDGSFTYVDQTLDVSYRSIHGAQAESEYVFIEGTNLPSTSQTQWSVLELGFGTGMNFSNTYAYTQKNNIKLEYYSLEPFLMPIEDLLINDNLKSELQHGKVESSDLDLNIIESKWEDWSSEKTFDAYYHDPFGPTTSPACWTNACFEWAFPQLKSHGRLATYGASSAGRKAMHAAGFIVAKQKGFGRKREMTLGAKSTDQLCGLKILNLQSK